MKGEAHCESVKFTKRIRMESVWMKRIQASHLSKDNTTVQMTPLRMNVTQIPAGARQIRVMDNSRNYLALMEANQHYVLNGEWAVDQPGAFEAAGTQWHYSRMANGHETLEAAGPTSKDLFITVLFQEESLSIDYQYWGPRKQTLHHAQGEAHALRQPQAREVEAQHPEEPADFPEATTRRFTKAQEVAKEAPQKKVTPAPLRTATAPVRTGSRFTHWIFSSSSVKQEDNQQVQFRQALTCDIGTKEITEMCSGTAPLPQPTGIIEKIAGRRSGSLTRNNGGEQVQHLNIPPPARTCSKARQGATEANQDLRKEIQLTVL
ncbi:ADAMTS-like protein 5, partial [Ophiophagus hannah]